MKQCTECKQQKPLDQYYKAARLKDGLQARCKKCAKEYTHQHGNMKKYVGWAKRNADRKATLLEEYKATLTCICCGETDSCCFDFHHVDPSTKFKSIVDMTRRYSWNRILEEIKKCVCVCASCHRKIHAGHIVCCSSVSGDTPLS